MSSDTTGHRRRRKVIQDCRSGSHRFGSPKPIGGGITRQICMVCGEVSIDVTRAHPTSLSTGRHDGAHDG